MSKFDGLIQAKLQQKAEKNPKAVKNPKVVNINSIKSELKESTSLPEIQTKVSEKNDKTKPPGKRSNPDYTQITAYIKKNTHETVMKKIYKRKELSELIEELLNEWISNPN